MTRLLRVHGLATAFALRSMQLQLGSYFSAIAREALVWRGIGRFACRTFVVGQCMVVLRVLPLVFLLYFYVAWYSVVSFLSVWTKCIVGVLNPTRGYESWAV